MLRDGTSRALSRLADDALSQTAVAENDFESGCHRVCWIESLGESVPGRDFLYWCHRDVRLCGNHFDQSFRCDGSLAADADKPLARPAAAISGNRHRYVEQEHHMVCGRRRRRNRERRHDLAHRLIYGSKRHAFASYRYRNSVK